MSMFNNSSMNDKLTVRRISFRFDFLFDDDEIESYGSNLTDDDDDDDFRFIFGQNFTDNNDDDNDDDDEYHSWH